MRKKIDYTKHNLDTANATFSKPLIIIFIILASALFMQTAGFKMLSEATGQCNFSIANFVFYRNAECEAQHINKEEETTPETWEETAQKRMSDSRSKGDGDNQSLRGRLDSTKN